MRNGHKLTTDTVAVACLAVYAGHQRRNGMQVCPIEHAVQASRHSEATDPVDHSPRNTCLPLHPNGHPNGYPSVCVCVCVCACVCVCVCVCV